MLRGQQRFPVLLQFYKLAFIHFLSESKLIPILFFSGQRSFDLKSDLKLVQDKEATPTVHLPMLLQRRQQEIPSVSSAALYQSAGLLHRNRRSISCLRRCLKNRVLHPAQCHHLC
jgi:hypothetical protein